MKFDIDRKLSQDGLSQKQTYYELYKRKKQTCYEL